MTSQTTFVPPQLSITAITDALGKSFRVEETRATRTPIEFFDSFDWRLWNEGLTVCRTSTTLWLARRGSIAENDAVESHAWPKTRKPPRMAEAWPEGPGAKTLEELLEIRALVGYARFDRSKKSFALKNRDDKIVVRIEIESFLPKGSRAKALARTLRVAPLRGYEHHRQVAEQALDGLGLVDAPDGVLELLAGQAARRPGHYTAKPDLGLQPEMPAGDAVRQMIQSMLSVAVSNESGIIADIDTEFLHDYRVTVRRIRSLLSLTKGVLGPKLTESLRKDFGALGRATNALRDLDVHLLEQHQHRGQIPEERRAGLDRMFDTVAKQRETEHRAVSRKLAAAGYRKTLERIERGLADERRREAAEFADVPIVEVAAARIAKQFRRVRRIGTSIDDQTPDETVHALRIECKKLRYLLEFFQPLFVGEGIRPFVKKLKKLQETLGDFNDLAVQQVWLVEHAKTAHRRRPQDFEQTLAIGTLVGALHHHQLQARGRVRELFLAFDDKAARKALHRTLKKAVPRPTTTEEPSPESKPC